MLVKIIFNFKNDFKRNFIIQRCVKNYFWPWDVSHLFLSIIEFFEATKRDLFEGNPDVTISTNDIWHEMTSQVDSFEKIQIAVAKRKKADNWVNNESSRSHLFVYIAEMKNDQQFKVVKSQTILDSWTLGLLEFWTLKHLGISMVQKVNSIIISSKCRNTLTKCDTSCQVVIKGVDDDIF